MHKYSFLTRINHWVVGLLIIFLLSLGYYMTSLTPAENKYYYYMIHKSFGVIALIFIIFRIFVSLRSVKPSYSQKISAVEVLLSKIGHFSLYVFMLTMALSGFLMSTLGGKGISFFGIKLPLNFTSNEGFSENQLGYFQDISKIMHEIHLFIPPIFIALIVIHVGAWPYHYIKDKVNIIKRII